MKLDSIVWTVSSLAAVVVVGILVWQFGSPQTAAEWVAAVGTIGAIWAAIWLGQRSFAEERNHLHARSRVTTFRLTPHIITILGDIKRARAAIPEAGTPYSTVFNNMPQTVQAMAIGSTIPQEIFGETWTLPPHIALAVAQLEWALSSHVRLIENVGGAIVALPPDERSKYLERVEVSLSALERLALEIRSYCTVISDEVVTTRRGKEMAS